LDVDDQLRHMKQLFIFLVLLVEMLLFGDVKDAEKWEKNIAA
jgi:hypothetical protein